MDKQRTNECIHIMYAHLILYYSKCIHLCMYASYIYICLHGATLYNAMVDSGLGLRLNAVLIVCLMPSTVH